MRLRRMGCERHIVRMGRMRTNPQFFVFFFKKSDRKRLRGRPSLDASVIKIELTKYGFKGVDWIHTFLYR
jgi:hypothetical protein